MGLLCDEYNIDPNGTKQPTSSKLEKKGGEGVELEKKRKKIYLPWKVDW